MRKPTSRFQKRWKDARNEIDGLIEVTTEPVGRWKNGRAVIGGLTATAILGSGLALSRGAGLEVGLITLTLIVGLLFLKDYEDKERDKGGQGPCERAPVPQTERPP